MTTHNKLEKAFGKIEKSQWLVQAEARRQGRSKKKRSLHIAVNVLDHLHKQGMSQKAFAELIGVTPQMVSKWLQGSENFTLETIEKIEEIIGFDLIEVKNKVSTKNNYTSEKYEQKEKYEKPVSTSETSMKTARIINISTNYPKTKIS